MSYEQWLALNDAERSALRADWNAYGPGYWHLLAHEAASSFAAEFERMPHVLTITHGLYHGGELIIAVHTDLQYPNKVPLPDMYVGFPVLQFCAAQPEYGRMSEQRDYARTAAMVLLALVVPVGIGLTIYWTVRINFPGITPGGWLLVCGYLLTIVVVPAALTRLLSRAVDLERYTWGRAWRVVAFVWVTVTAIAGLLAWPAIGPYIKPFFVGSGPIA